MFKKKLGYYLLLVGQLFVGFLIILSVNGVGISKSYQPIVLFVLFVLLNLGVVAKFKIKDELISNWSIRKIHFLFIGIVLGLTVAFFPLLIALLSGQIVTDDLTLKTNLGVSSILGTFLIVSWEELWFRSLLLNYCKRNLSITSISIFMGLLFMFIHLLNPKFDIVNSGLTLFFAGTFLTIIYLYYKNIWLPIGLHFGNNHLQSILKSKLDDNLIFGHDGYFSALILAAISIFFIFKINNRRKLDLAK